MKFGAKIRAGRLRWAASTKHGCQVRISDVTDTRWKVELWPLDQIVPALGSKGPYRDIRNCAADILDLTDFRKVRRVKMGFSVVVDETGRVVT